MPRVVVLPKDNEWKNATFEADFSDSNFGFLSNFEEVLPESLIVEKKKKKNAKTKTSIDHVNGSVASDEVSKGAEKGEKKKKKRNKKKNKKKKTGEVEDKVDEEKEFGHEDEESAGDNVAEQPVSEKKKKNKKRKNGLEEKQVEDPPKKKKKQVKINEKVEKVVEVEETAEDETPAVKTDTSAWDHLYLPQTIIDTIAELRFAEPTEIQKLVIPSAVRDRQDILGAAETGSGKTLAYLIPLMIRLMNEPREGSGPRALILAPTRELAVQVLKVLEVFEKHTKQSATYVLGGLAQVKQERITAQRKPEILVATPGRLWAMMKDAEDKEYLGDWSGLRCIVVDEADRMVESGHFEEMAHILKKIKGTQEEDEEGEEEEGEGEKKEGRADKIQTMVFSATLTYVLPTQTTPGVRNQKKELTAKQKLARLIEITGLRSKRKVFDITREYGTAESLMETRINCSDLLDKDTSVMYLLNRYAGRTLIFTNSVDASRRLYGVLNNLKVQPAPMVLHAKMIQRQRLRNLERFAADERSTLIATDVAARGLDIQNIEHVIHYQVPKTAETYIHRSGRTARAHKKGLSVVLVDSKDCHLYRKMCKNLNREKDLPVFPIDSPQLMNALKRRVKLASALDTTVFRMKKIRMNETWFEKAAREAEIELDDRQREQDGANDAMNSMKIQQLKLQAELRSELNIPLPSINSSVPKSRYITPEICKSYDQDISKQVLDTLQQNLDHAALLKKNNRKNIKTHNLKRRNFKGHGKK